ncbi:MAG: 4Fe-4S binding protein [Candidatus Bathyarchaeota archaeon]|nr:MAG: 4Fe-4S binding protein [Candidatus Bathyarchaeota archaeon]
MVNDVYRKLAKRLDAIPNGFPQTESGIELRLLEKIFTNKEAALASKMRLTSESASQIAERINQNPAEIRTLLDEMVKKGLIRASGNREQRKFGLMPFVVGIYEAQLGRLDKETALQFEKLYQAFAEQVLSHSPSLHKVIPVEKSIPVEVQVFPYEQASALLEKAKSFGVLKCICRVQKSLIGEPCKYPTDICLAFSPVEGSFDNSPTIKAISKEEALQLLQKAEDAGLIHSSSNVREGHHYICNCCTCCCGIMRGIAQLGIENSVAKSDFYAFVDPEVCIGCGKCLERCQFNAPFLTNEISQVDQTRCVGCGLCVVTCPSEAMRLVRKSEGQISVTPQNRKEWMKKRAENRAISLQAIL